MMKLEPIKNPHSKVGQVMKKTKQEEKDELIDKTKKTTLDKYGVSTFTIYYIMQCYLEKSSWQKVYANNRCYEWLRLKCKISYSFNVAQFGDKDDFKLEEKITKEVQGIKLICKLRTVVIIVV